MKIIIKCRTEIGDTIYWNGDSSNLETINNTKLLSLAKLVASNGETQTFGSWIIEKEK